MDIKQQILHYYRVEDRSLRDISRLTNTDRKTVTRLVNAFEAAVKENPDTGATLGVWLEWWDICEGYRQDKDGRERLITFFSGSPLSGVRCKWEPAK